jgi:signal transduction histidine kinase
MYKLKILTVDDELNMLSGIKRILKNYSPKLTDIDEIIEFEVDTASSGEEALNKLSENRPDILLLDYKMPGLSGMDVLHKIDNNDGNMVVIMITAFASLQTAVSAIKSGAFDFIAKPFTPDELKSIIDKATQSLILSRHVKKLEEEKRQIRFQFISVLGHELKAPLSAVEGYLYMLSDKSLGNELDAYDEVISRCLIRTEGMRKLILDILEMTKIESGTRQRHIETLNLNDMINQSLDLVSVDADQKQIKVVNGCPNDLVITGDKMDFEIVLNNLLSNAVKYNRQGGEVRISVIRDNEKLRLEVADTGIGLTDEECTKLFGEFVRIKNEKTKTIQGSGLGLSTVKKISKLYDGDVHVESEPDKGSKFIFIFGEMKKNP